MIKALSIKKNVQHNLFSVNATIDRLSISGMPTVMASTHGLLSLVMLIMRNHMIMHG